MARGRGEEGGGGALSGPSCRLGRRRSRSVEKRGSQTETTRRLRGVAGVIVVPVAVSGAVIAVASILSVIGFPPFQGPFPGTAAAPAFHQFTPPRGGARPAGGAGNPPPGDRWAGQGGRPAAQQQLQVLGEQTGIPVMTPVLGEQPVAIANRAMDTGRREGYDVVILDTAGRLVLDQDMMTEVVNVRMAAGPSEVLLVTDAMTGQDAVTIAKEFNEKVGVTGIVLTRVDGDARGGAALSMRQVTGCPIKFLGTGEKSEALEPFRAESLANRILGRFARSVFVQFAETARRFAPGLARVTGIPVRRMPDTATTVQRDSETEAGLVRLLVFGGSQGARSLNRAVLANLPSLDSRDGFRITHQTGSAELAAVRSVNSALGSGFLPKLLLLPTMCTVANVTPPLVQVWFSTNLENLASPDWLTTVMGFWPKVLPSG